MYNSADFNLPIKRSSLDYANSFSSSKFFNEQSLSIPSISSITPYLFNLLKSLLLPNFCVKTVLSTHKWYLIFKANGLFYVVLLFNFSVRRPAKPPFLKLISQLLQPFTISGPLPISLLQSSLPNPFTNYPHSHLIKIRENLGSQNKREFGYFFFSLTKFINSNQFQVTMVSHLH